MTNSIGSAEINKETTQPPQPTMPSPAVADAAPSPAPPPPAPSKAPSVAASAAIKESSLPDGDVMKGVTSTPSTITNAAIATANLMCQSTQPALGPPTITAAPSNHASSAVAPSAIEAATAATANGAVACTKNDVVPATAVALALTSIVAPETKMPPPPYNNNNTSPRSNSSGSISPTSSTGSGSSSKKRIRPSCSHPNCSNRSVQGGVCVTHGAKRPICNHPGCTKAVKSAGFCSTHGPSRRVCDAVGCRRVAVQGGKCVTHGAKRPNCKYLFDGQSCNKLAIMGGYCKKHYDMLVEDATLLNSLFYSSAASASGEDEEEDDKSALGYVPSEDVQSLVPPAEPKMDLNVVSQEMNELETKSSQEVPQASNGVGVCRTMAMAVPRLPPKTNPDPLQRPMDICVDKTQSYKSPFTNASANSYQISVEERAAAALFGSQFEPPRKQSTFDKVLNAQLHAQAESQAQEPGSYPSLPMSSSTETNGSSSSTFSKKSKDQRHPKLGQAAVDYLRSWMLSKQHFEQPYPTEQTYSALGAATGLDKTQLKNWFVNNRRRLWRPMMNEIRRRYNLSEQDVLPQHVLDTLEDAPVFEFQPPPPYPKDSASGSPATLQPLAPDAPISTAADSVAAAAMMMMTGSSRTTSPDETLEGFTDTTIGEAKPDKAMSESEGQNSPWKEVVAFDVGGTVVHLPSNLLLKNTDSKLASMARSAMRVINDVPFPIHRDYEMFSHCVFYLCNSKVLLPIDIRRKSFMKEMKYYGIPYVESSINGGCDSNGNFETRKKNQPRPGQVLSPNDITQLSYTPVAPTVPSSGHQPGSNKLSYNPVAPSVPASGPQPGLNTGMPLEQSQNRATKEAATEAMTKPPSALDLLSSAVTTSIEATRTPRSQTKSPIVRKTMCGKCEACVREDCGECRECLNKKKFGGNGKLRKKCAKRTCPFMAPHSFVISAKSASPTDSIEAKSNAPPNVAGTDASDPLPTEETKIVPPNLAVIAAEKRWSENIEFLRPCIEYGGYINYAVIPDEETRNRVKNFVKEQRKQHRRRESNEITSMTDERLEILQDINFPFVFRPYVKKPSSQSPPTLPATVAEVPTKKPTSSLDLLCSITSQSFAESSLLFGDSPAGLEEAEEEEEEVEAQEEEVEEEEDEDSMPDSPPPVSTEPVRLHPYEHTYAHRRPRGPNCGECNACLQDDCGECRACKDKTKFGGPNTLKKRCYNRYCLHRPSQGNPADAKSVPNKQHGSRNEEAKMKAELARIRAELDAKAQAVEYGFKMHGVPKWRSGGTIETADHGGSQNEADDEASESDEVEDEVMESDDGSKEEDEIMKDTPVAQANVARKRRCLDAELPRGVTMRPSGKWQVQIYYAGNSCYLGLFDTKEEAAVGYELARECRETFSHDPAPEKVKKNLNLMRKAAFSAQIFSDPPKSDHSKDKSLAKGKPRSLASVQAKPKPKKPSGPSAKAQVVKVAELDSKPQDAKPKPIVKAAAAAVKKTPSDGSQTSDKNLKKIKKIDDKVMADTEESLKRKSSPDIYEKAKALAERLPRGITMRPSGKWQVQLYYAGKSRYIGVFNTKLDAAVGYELARECISSVRDEDASPEQEKKNVMLMRKAAFSFQDSQDKNKFQDALSKKRKTSKSECSSYTQSSQNKKPKIAPKPAKNADAGQLTMGTQNGNTQHSRIQKTKTAPKPAKAADTGQSILGPQSGNTQRSQKQKPKIAPKTAKAADAGQLTVGPKNGISDFSKKAPPQHSSIVAPISATTTKSSTIAEALPGVAASGIIKELPEIGPGWKLSMVPRKSGERADYYYFSPQNKRFRSIKEAKAYAESENVQEQSSCQLFGVGYKFRKNFLDESGKSLGWFDGEVVDVLTGTDKDRKCLYAADGYIEDLSIAELKELAEMESKDLRKEKAAEKTIEVVQHNDLCETCGKGGELLCCATCNLVFHLGCTRPMLEQIPNDDWSCPFCVASGDTAKGTAKQEQKKARAAVQEIEALKEEARKKAESRRKSPRIRQT